MKLVQLCRTRCGKPLAFRGRFLLFEALPRRRSRRPFKDAEGKAVPFRNRSGKASQPARVCLKGSPNEIPSQSTHLSLCARSDHLSGSHCHLRCRTANTRHSPHWSRGVGLGRWSLYTLVRHIRNPDWKNGRSSRCAASTDAHCPVVVRLYCTYRSNVELLRSLVGSLLLWSW